MSIKYVTGDATLPQGQGRKIIAHVCNDQNAWGAGFVLALSKRDRTPEHGYHRWFAGDYSTIAPKLGEIQIVPYDQINQPDTYVCNMIAQVLDWKGRLGAPTIPLRLWALRHCLAKLNQRAKFGMASIHMPRIGCGLAGGKWEDVEPIIESTLVNCPVTVYDLPLNPATGS